MEEVNCLVCSSAQKTLYVKKDSFNIVRCSGCSMVYVTPRLTFEELEEFYDNNYREYLDSYESDLLRKTGAINWIRKYKPGGKFLDIGCSVGAMLEAAGPYFEATGIDVAVWALEEARKRGLNVVHGTLEEANFGDETFDVITFTEVIEHIHDPLVFLKEVNRILKPGGVVYLTTGNVEGWRAKKDKGQWFYLTPQFHVAYYSPKTIRRVLKDAGFEVIEVGGHFRLKDMMRLWKFYPDKLQFIKGCIGKISFGDFTFGDMGVIARKL